MMSLSASCQAEVLSPTVYCSDLTTSGVSMTAVLVVTALGVLCTKRCFREDFPTSGGPTKMDRVTATDTEPCFPSDSLYADCHSEKARSSRGLCTRIMKNATIMGIVA